MTIAAQGFAPASGQEGFSRTARKALAQVLSSPDFDASRRLRDYLRFVVEEALAGRGEHLTPAAIATGVFGRKDDFDPLLDPIVRIQAGRLRRCLERYYLRAGKVDPVRIHLPRGSYLPVFSRADKPQSAGATAPVSPELLLPVPPANAAAIE